MPGKPKQFSAVYASMFQDASVVSAYQHRPMYPPDTFIMLASLIPSANRPGRVLDAGCGTGFIARPLAIFVEHIDAVDISARMIAMARTQPGGDQPNITWIAAPIETAPLTGPYALIVAAASLHWMDWERTLPRFAEHLAPDGVLALVEENHSPNPWDAQVGRIIARFSLNKDFAPYSMASLAEALESRGLFQLQGRHEIAAAPFRQPVDAYIRSYHARNGLSLDRMEPLAAAQFDAGLREALAPYCPQGTVTQQVSAHVLWGKPIR